ncbi:MAG: Do family serine endopeptidase [Burkholderiales bacterium]|nr:Do family serine endopeptidase [Burkholderiales bacterium]
MSRQATLMKPIAAAVGLALALGGASFAWQNLSQAEPTPPPPSTFVKPADAAPATPVAIAALPDFSGIVAQQGPAVVNIVVQGRGADSAGGARRFGGRPPLPFPFGPDADASPADTPPQRGLGSGFVISPDGYVVTNAHVVRGATEITVRFADKREMAARVVGQDDGSDIALLKVDAKALPTVTIGDSAALKVGQWVLAIGAPFGFDRTATQGIVSALGRNLPDDSYVPFIQTDVPINPGNSGGPLFDTRGRVVGVNSQIYSGTGGYMGLSFAIPIDVAMQVAEQLRTDGRVTRGWIGLSLQDVNQDLAKSFGMDLPRGGVVTSVKSGGPAERAGLQPGDVIVGFDGRPLAGSGDLPPLVGASKPGESRALTVLRDGKERTLAVRIGELPGAAKPRVATADDRAAGSPRLGIAVSALDARARSELGVPQGGLLVQQVGPGAAATAGVQPGDVLLSLAGTPLRDVEQLRALAATLPTDRAVPLLVKRDDATVFLALKAPKKPIG